MDELMNLVSELVTTQARLALFSGQNQLYELTANSENLEKITRRPRDNAFTTSLIPIESFVVRFQRLVRDLSRELNKDIVFKIDQPHLHAGLFHGQHSAVTLRIKPWPHALSCHRAIHSFNLW